MHAPGGFSVLVVGGVVAAAYGLARAIFSSTVETRASQLEKLVSTLSLQIEDLVAAESSPRSLR
jgi:hypothetical protein